MTRNDGFRLRPADNSSDRRMVNARALRQELNHPVPVDEFDRERMGIAAKE